MIEWTVGVGIPVLALIQGANFYRSGKLLDKMDNLVTKESFEEHKRTCDSKLCGIEHNIGHHSHNGEGVKFTPK